MRKPVKRNEVVDFSVREIAVRVDEIGLADERHVLVLQDAVLDSILAVDGKNVIEAVGDVVAGLDFHFAYALDAAVLVEKRFSGAYGDDDGAGVAVVADDFESARLAPGDGLDEDLVSEWAKGHGDGLCAKLQGVATLATVGQGF